jgi:hypothetical protein
LPNDDCPTTRREFFLNGNEPSQTDTFFTRVYVNSVSGELATVLSPIGFVQEQIYMNLSPEAAEWARAKGIELVPQDYDPVPVMTASGAGILQPRAFAAVEGTINITASFDNSVNNYDVQIGSGLYPEEWILVDAGQRMPRSGLLAEWDTTGLAGVYSIQVQLRDFEDNLIRLYTVVTIQN